MPWIRPVSTRFSRAVAIGSLDAFCDTNPISCRTAVGSRRTSRPATSACPESGRDRVVRILTVVDLPAPFGPSSANTLPAATSSDRPSRARIGGAPRPAG